MFTGVSGSGKSSGTAGGTICFEARWKGCGPVTPSPVGTWATYVLDEPTSGLHLADV